MRVTMIVAALCTLGCAGMGSQFTQDFNKEFVKSFRTSFTDSCSQGGDDRQRRVCACVADELVTTLKPADLMGLMDHPEKVQPIMEKCAKTLVQ